MPDALQLDWLSLTRARAVRKLGTKGLLADVPRSRRNDPDTSHAAAEHVRRSGVLAGHQQKILDTVRAHPGLTYQEIALQAGLEKHAVARRLKELEPMHVKRGAPRSYGGRPCSTWWPA